MYQRTIYFIDTFITHLNFLIDACNKESKLHIQLVLNEPNAFQAEKSHYGQFKNCKNYLVIVGPKGKDEDAGYYAEKIVNRIFKLHFFAE